MDGMDGMDEGQAQLDAREKAANLLKDRHERESEALAALIAALSRRARAVEVVKAETVQIVSRLDEMSRFGFDDAALAELGIDIAEIRRSGSRVQRPTPGEQSATETPADTGAEDQAAVDLNAEEEANSQAASTGEHAGGVRTTAHLTGSMLNRVGATRR